MKRPNPAKWEAPATWLGLALALVAVALRHWPGVEEATRAAACAASAGHAAAYLWLFPCDTQ